MSAFLFRAEFEGDRSVQLVPSHVRPFGVAEIRALEADGKAALELELYSDAVLVDGEEQSGHVRVKTDVVFNKETYIFSLTDGGWLPMPFTIPPRFLVDRNVVISLRRIREGKTVAVADSLLWWTKMFEDGGAMFNPLPYAFEAGLRRKPTLAEFSAAYDEGVAELEAALPACEVIRFADVHYRAAYSQLEAFDQRHAREVSFLRAAVPLVTNRTNRQKQWRVADEIVRLADMNRVNRASLVSLAVMSCLFETIDGEPPAIGRQVLKPASVYSEGDAFNALSDLRHLELATAGRALFKEAAFSLCTCDRPLALLWSALAPRGEFTASTAVDVKFDVTQELFARLDEDELQRLKELLQA
jgi:hypothetical protein